MAGLRLGCRKEEPGEAGASPFLQFSMLVISSLRFSAGELLAAERKWEEEDSNEDWKIIFSYLILGRMDGKYDGTFGD